MGRPTKCFILDRRAVNRLMAFARVIPPAVKLAPGRQVRALRTYLRLPQAALASLSGIPQETISRLEAGRRSMRLATIRRLFDAMECDTLVLPLPRRRLGDAIAESELAELGPDPPWPWPWPLSERRVEKRS